MDYHHHYNKLISQAKERNQQGYLEVHHIVPKCFGGTNDADNLVGLTAREHYIAHLLLYKMQSTKKRKYQMLKACIMMAGKDKTNSRMYETARHEFSRLHSERIRGENHPMYGVSRAGEDNPFYGKNHSTETKNLLSEAGKDKVVAKNKFNGEIVKVSKVEFDNNPDLVGVTAGATVSDKVRKKCGNGTRNKIYINDGVSEIRIFAKDMQKYPKFNKGRLLHSCPHCDKMVDINNLKRWHLENCKNVHP